MEKLLINKEITGMNKKMFCFQCEQTAGCTGCTGNAGVCGKNADTAKLQDELTGALIGLARAVDSAAAISKRTIQVIIEGLFTTVTNVNFNDKTLEDMICLLYTSDAADEL